MKFTDDEQYKEGYDLNIMIRLIGFLKPYKALSISIVSFIILATAAELTTPVIMQRIIDIDIISLYKKVDLKKVDLKTIQKLNKIKSKFVFENYGYYFYSKLEKSFDKDFVKKMEKDKVFLKKYYVGYQKDIDKNFIKKHQDIFSLQGDIITVSFDDFKTLSHLEKNKLRLTHYDSLFNMSMIFLMVLVLQMIFSFARGFSIEYAGQSIMKQIRVNLFTHIQEQALSFIQKNPVGKLVTRISNDVEAINQFFSGFLVNMITSIMSLIGVTLVMLFLDVRLSLIAFASLPLVIIITIVYKNLSRKAFRNVRSWSSYINSYIAERINGIEIVKYFVREDKTRSEFDEINEQLKEYDLKELYIFAVFRPMVDLIATLSSAFLIYFGAKEVLGDIISLGIVLAFTNLISKFYNPIMQISESFNILQSAMTSGERIFYYLDTHQEIPDKGTKIIEKNNAKGEISFEDVSFAYVKEEYILKNLNFRIKPGEMIALIGYTGSGKTTITNLITRMWDIQKGSIKFDGIDIRDLKLSNLRSIAQSLQQDVFLFNATIKENILMGEDVSEERLKEVIKVAQLEDFIQSLPNHLDYMVEEGAKNLSAGQKQLISFARIMVQNPQVIIMDEATANIDTETEKKVQKAMDELMKGKTSIVVAHRLSTIKNANRIFVLKDGYLIEEGSHDELIQKEEGMYKNLYTLQYKEEIEQK